MKRLAILGSVMASVFVGSVAHAQGYGMAGCGLGSLVIKDDGGIQILAATTNGTFGSQTFGITSGTSNCASGGVVKAQREQAAFAEVNFRDLKRNMATGGGEFLTSFSSLLGCEDTAKPEFAKMTQSKYEAILPSETTGPMEMLRGVKTQIKADPALASACSDERAVARAEGKTKVAPKAKTEATKQVALAQSPKAVK